MYVRMQMSSSKVNKTTVLLFYYFLASILKGDKIKGTLFLRWGLEIIAVLKIDATGDIGSLRVYNFTKLGPPPATTSQQFSNLSSYTFMEYICLFIENSCFKVSNELLSNLKIVLRFDYEFLYTLAPTPLFT